MLYRIENLGKKWAREGGWRLLIRRLHVEAGARLAITGPSGCGKSTTLDLLGLALEPDSAGAFLFAPCNQAIDAVRLWREKRLDAMAALRLAHMGYVLQTGGLLPFLNVIDNMLLTARMAGLPEAAAREQAMALSRQLGIEGLLRAMPATLSIGERQRVAIVRALTPKPALILADEPTAALDPAHAARVMEAFLSAVDEQGGTLILVTHNAGWARRGGLTELPFVMEEDEQGLTAVLDDRRDEALSPPDPAPARGPSC